MVEFAHFNHAPMETPSRDIASQCPAGQWMTESNMALIELLQKHDEGDLSREP